MVSARCWSSGMESISAARRFLPFSPRLTINKAGWSVNNFCSLAVRGIVFIKMLLSAHCLSHAHTKLRPFSADCKGCFFYVINTSINWRKPKGQCGIAPLTLNPSPPVGERGKFTRPIYESKGLHQYMDEGTQRIFSTGKE